MCIQRKVTSGSLASGPEVPYLVHVQSIVCKQEKQVINGLSALLDLECVRGRGC